MFDIFTEKGCIIAQIGDFEGGENSYTVGDFTLYSF